MDYSTILLQSRGPVAMIILNRPDQLNAINETMSSELLDALRYTARNNELRAVILTGAGNAFCAGAGLQEGVVGPIHTAKDKAEQIRQSLRHGPQKVTQTLYDLEKPVIAMVNGVAAGGGFDWAMACDIRIGSEKTRFRVGFTSIGLFPGTGGTWLLPRLVGPARAAELLFTDRVLEAPEAERLGLLNRVVPSGELDTETAQLATRIAAGPPIALRLAKMQLHRGLTMDLCHALEMAAALETITLTSDDHRDGVTAFIEKRRPQFKGR